MGSSGCAAPLHGWLYTAQQEGSRTAGALARVPDCEGTPIVMNGDVPTMLDSFVESPRERGGRPAAALVLPVCRLGQGEAP